MPVATAKMFGSKMMSSAGSRPRSSGRLYARAQISTAPLQRVGLALLVEGHHDTAAP
jgi:hypothetical protein